MEVDIQVLIEIVDGSPGSVDIYSRLEKKNLVVVSSKEDVVGSVVV